MKGDAAVTLCHSAKMARVVSVEGEVEEKKKSYIYSPKSLTTRTHCNTSARGFLTRCHLMESEGVQLRLATCPLSPHRERVWRHFKKTHADTFQSMGARLCICIEIRKEK